jgi:hypothetical protein
MTFTGPSALLGRTPLRQIADGSEFPRNHWNITMSAIVQRIGIVTGPLNEYDAEHDSSGAYAESDDFPHGDYVASAKERPAAEGQQRRRAKRTERGNRAVIMLRSARGLQAPRIAATRAACPSARPPR